MKLALIGKNISHSRSPEVYKSILKDEYTSCDLLDYPNEKAIPTLAELFKNLHGISITSPYKKFFLAHVTFVNCPKEIPGINCLRFLNNKFEATNTDFHAIKDILISMAYQLTDKEIIILGDGVMSKVTELVLQELNFSYKIMSRKKTAEFNQLSLSKALVINSCSRDYIFEGKIGKNVIFWDYNYNFLPHQSALPGICEHYIDGFSMLELQAKYAVKFWKNVTV